MQTLDLPDRPIAMELAGVLRLANALDLHHARKGNAPRLEVALQDRSVIIRAPGYSALDQSAEAIAAARHLLETVLCRSVLVRTLRTPVAGRKLSVPRKTRIRRIS